MINSSLLVFQDDAMKDSSQPQSSVQIPEQFRGLSVNQIQEMAQRQQQQVSLRKEMYLCHCEVGSTISVKHWSAIGI